MSRLYIDTVVSATLAQVQTIFSFRRTTLNLFMLASCLGYRVKILFKCIFRLRNIQIFHNFRCSYNAELLKPYYSNQCSIAQLQTTFSFCRTTPNLFISTLWFSLYSFYFLSAFGSWETYRNLPYSYELRYEQ